MRFPTATGAQVRTEVLHQVRSIDGARRTFWLAVLMLSVGAALSMAVPILLGRIVDVVMAGEL